MGVIGAYLNIDRKNEAYQDIDLRTLHYNEFTIALSEDELKSQGARCMDCGVPFCHSGCPLGNVIPDFNHAVAMGDWKTAAEYLFQTNSFPEFTGRVCPAPCESSCVLNINRDAVSIKLIEKRIIETAYENGWVKNTEVNPSGFKVAVIGSGPAGLAAADKLCSLGHSVTVFEKDKHFGGLLRYGIPDFKLEKQIVERRIDVMKTSGIKFVSSTEVGKDISIEELDNNYDAVLFAIGAQKPRDIQIPGKNLKGVHFAMEYLSQSNKYVSGENDTLKIDVKGKKVLIIGGGDTGSDCLGTAIRQGASKVVQVDIVEKPESERNFDNPWPEYPKTIKTSSSQQEGGERQWALQTLAFLGKEKLEAVEMQNVTWENINGRASFSAVDNSKKIEEFDYAFIAAGFVSPIIEGLIETSNIELSERNNIVANTDDFKTSRHKFFAAGDARRGQSLVVWALSEGRDAAIAIDNFLISQ